MVSGSRLYLILGVIGFALAVLLRGTPAKLPLMFVLAAVAGYNVVLALKQFSEIHRRPAAFTVSGRRVFSARLLYSQAPSAMMGLVFAGTFAADTWNRFDEPDWAGNVFTWIYLAFTGLLIMIAVLLTVIVWNMDQARIELTPDGVATRMPRDRRFVPWEALCPGGPLRPNPKEGYIRLVFARPELVRYNRFRLPVHAKDRILTMTDVHPWFVADAIGWYAEHPEHRAAIGTEAEHARLAEAVGAATYAAAPVSLPQQPPPVRTAIRFGYAGVVFGPLTAVLDVVLLSATKPSGWNAGVHLAEGWYMAASLLIIFVALVAMVALTFLKHGNQWGRIGLIAVSALAIVWAVVPYDMAVVLPDGLTPLLIAVTVVKRLGYLGLGMATLMLLLKPAAKAFTKRTEIKRTEMRPA